MIEGDFLVMERIQTGRQFEKSPVSSNEMKGPCFENIYWFLVAVKQAKSLVSVSLGNLHSNWSTFFRFFSCGLLQKFDFLLERTTGIAKIRNASSFT